MTKNLDSSNEITGDRDARPAEAIEPAHLARVEAGLADVREGRLATQDEVELAFARFRRRL